jgi:hypothetical protein
MAVLRILVIAFSFFVIGLTGCAEKYRYIPPTSEAGLECVTECLSMKNTCREHELERARAAQRECEKRSSDEYFECKRRTEEELAQCQEKAKEEYIACLKYASDRSSCHEEECEEKSCHKRGCYESANFRACESDYRDCYQQCGGVIEVIE